MSYQEAVNYLQENKDKFAHEILKQQLSNSGYPLEIIESAAKEVFEGAPRNNVGQETKPSFWNFKDNKHYTSGGQKVADFLFGFFVVPLVNIIPFIGMIFYIFLLFYFFKRRFYIFLGMIVTVVAMIVLMLFFFGLLSSIVYGLNQR